MLNTFLLPRLSFSDFCVQYLIFNSALLLHAAWNWKKRKQLGLDKPHVDMAEVLRMGSQNVRTSEEFLEFLKTQEGTLIEVGDGNFEMSEEMMKDKMVC